MFKSIHVSFVFTYIIFVIFFLCSAVKIRLLSPERPKLVYHDPKYIRYVNVSARRFGRHNPAYYISMHFDILTGFGNNFTANFYTYEYSGTKYHRTYIDLHFMFCDLLAKDKLFGAPMMQGKLLGPCPFPAGEYHLYNMTLKQEELPRGFPITKGRIWSNLSITSTEKVVGSGYIDVEIKELNEREYEKVSKNTG